MQTQYSRIPAVLKKTTVLRGAYLFFYWSLAALLFAPQLLANSPYESQRSELLKTGHVHMRDGQYELARTQYWKAMMGGLVKEGFDGYELAWVADGAEYRAHLDVARAFYLRAWQEAVQQGRCWSEDDLTEAKAHLAAATQLNPDDLDISRLAALIDAAQPGSEPSTPQMPISESFSTVYDLELWGDGSSSARSGPGSSLEATQLVSGLLMHMVLTYNISSLLDAACGGLAWMPSVLQSIELIRGAPGLGNGSDEPFRYTCIEVVPDLVKSLRIRFENQAHWQFLSGDISDSTLVLKAHDLILARDFLFHLSTPRVIAILDAFRRSGSRFLIVTHNPYSLQNIDRAIWHAGAPVQHGAKSVPISFTGGLDQGGYRPINLHLPPYNLPSPIWEVIDDVKSDSQADARQGQRLPAMTRVLSMWSLSQLENIEWSHHDWNVAL